jgi:hypothetical protein
VTWPSLQIFVSCLYLLRPEWFAGQASVFSVNVVVQVTTGGGGWYPEQKADCQLVLYAPGAQAQQSGLAVQAFPKVAFGNQALVQ